MVEGAGGVGASMENPAAAQMPERTSRVLLWSAGSEQADCTQGVTTGVSSEDFWHEQAKLRRLQPRPVIAVVRHVSEHVGMSVKPWAATMAVSAVMMRVLFILEMVGKN